MKINEILLFKFPKEIANDIIMLSDSGDKRGIYISRWDLSLGPKPDQALLDKWAMEVAPIKEKQDARQNRRNEYPAIGDQLDALMRHMESKEAAGDILEAGLKKVKDEWRAVKDKYPILGE